MCFRHRLLIPVFGTLFALLLLGAPVFAAGSASGFEGKWELDKKAQQGVGGPEDLQVELKQDGPKLVVKSKYKEPKSAVYPLLWVGIMTYELELTTDGTEKVNQ